MAGVLRRFATMDVAFIYSSTGRITHHRIVLNSADQKMASRHRTLGTLAMHCSTVSSRPVRNVMYIRYLWPAVKNTRRLQGRIFQSII